MSDEKPGMAAERSRPFAGVDSHVLLTLAFRGWSIVAGAVSMVLLPLWLSPTQQGYYYTFGSLLAMQIFFELGLNQVIIQMVSQEAAHLGFTKGGALSGDPLRLARLGALVRLIVRWYSAAALLFAFVAGLAGWAFFGRQGSLPAAEWAAVWAALVVFSAVNLFLSPQLAVFEGTGDVGPVARLRLIQSLLGYAAMWTVLILGAGLWAVVVVPSVSSLVTVAWLRVRGDLLRHLRQQRDGAVPSVRWRRDVLPMQWRIAASWVSGYFMFHLFTPIAFAHHGAAEAGRLGMAMAVFNAVTTLGLSWVGAKAPAFTMHISRGEFTALDTLFKTVTRSSVAFTAAFAFLVVAVVALAAGAGVTAVGRIASPWTLVWLACAAVTNTAVYAAASYMRAHREEPMVPISVACALLTIAAVAVSADAGVSTMMALYAAIVTSVSLPWTLYLLCGYRARHRSAAPATPAGLEKR